MELWWGQVFAGQVIQTEKEQGWVEVVQLWHLDSPSRSGVILCPSKCSFRLDNIQWDRPFEKLMAPESEQDVETNAQRKSGEVKAVVKF